MKTRALKDMNRGEIQLIVDAMRTYRLKLTGFDQKLFDLDYKKVLAMGKEVELDGLGMKQISTALKQKGLLLYSLYGQEKKKRERHICFNLSNKVDLIRLQFQQEQGPKINETQTAVTVHVSA